QALAALRQPRTLVLLRQQAAVDRQAHAVPQVVRAQTADGRERDAVTIAGHGLRAYWPRAADRHPPARCPGGAANARRTPAVHRRSSRPTPPGTRPRPAA